MDTDVKSITVTADGVAVAGACRLRGVVGKTTAASGSVNLKNEGDDGDILMSFFTGNTLGMFDFNLPGNGVYYPDALYVALDEVSSLTIFYDG